jgi:hypothetical protein
MEIASNNQLRSALPVPCSSLEPFRAGIPWWMLSVGKTPWQSSASSSASAHSSRVRTRAPSVVANRARTGAINITIYILE